MFIINSRLRPHEIETLAEKIVGIFVKEEKSTYFTPSKKKSKEASKHIPIGGKLAQKYRNMRKQLSVFEKFKPPTNECTGNFYTHILISVYIY